MKTNVPMAIPCTWDTDNPAAHSGQRMKRINHRGWIVSFLSEVVQTNDVGAMTYQQFDRVLLVDDNGQLTTAPLWDVTVNLDVVVATQK